jgi:hypothetical protein
MLPMPTSPVRQPFLWPTPDSYLAEAILIAVRPAILLAKASQPLPGQLFLWLLPTFFSG